MSGRWQDDADLSELFILAQRCEVHLDPDDPMIVTLVKGAREQPADGGTLSELQRHACQVVNRVARSHVGTQLDRVIRTRQAAYLASALMPLTSCDVWGRFTVEIDEFGELPEKWLFEHAFDLARDRLASYLQHAEWVDPVAIAGEVADLHDAALALEVLERLDT